MFAGTKLDVQLVDLSFELAVSSLLIFAFSLQLINICLEPALLLDLVVDLVFQLQFVAGREVQELDRVLDFVQSFIFVLLEQSFFSLIFKLTILPKLVNLVLSLLVDP